MKKNEQYVGVDEKYIPEDEKYVDDDFNNEIKSDVHNIYKGAKEYISDGENQDKMKEFGKNGLKIAKGIGIGYLVFMVLMFLMVIMIFILVFSQIFNIRKQGNEFKDRIERYEVSVDYNSNDYTNKLSL